jgi:arylsulfatase A-like enzyme
MANLGRAVGAFVGEGVSYFGKSDMQKNIAQALRSVGYTTGMVGKWGLHSQADKADFDAPVANQKLLVQSAGFDFVDGLYIQNQNLCTLKVCSSFSHNMEWLTESALRFMDGAMKQDLPFFLYFAATLPHSPPYSSDALLGLFNSSQTPAGVLPKPPNISRYCSSCKVATRAAIWNASTIAPNAKRRHELAALRWVDESLGVVYDFLSEMHAIENTYIVISTDHGPLKGSLYEQGTRVPLYVVGPGIAANTRVTDLISHVDMAPTFMEWAGCGIQNCSSSGSDDVDGISWASLVSGKASSLDREEIYIESMLDRAVLNKNHMKFITRRTQDIEQLLTNPEDEHMRCRVVSRLVNLTEVSGAYPAFGRAEQLYDLIGDHLEQVNLASAIYSPKVIPDGIEKYRDRIVAHDALTYSPPAAATLQA